MTLYKALNQKWQLLNFSEELFESNTVTQFHVQMNIVNLVCTKTRKQQKSYHSRYCFLKICRTATSNSTQVNWSHCFMKISIISSNYFCMTCFHKVSINCPSNGIYWQHWSNLEPKLLILFSNMIVKIPQSIHPNPFSHKSFRSRFFPCITYSMLLVSV